MWKNPKSLSWEPFDFIVFLGQTVLRPKEVKMIVLSCETMGISVRNDSGTFLSLLQFLRTVALELTCLFTYIVKTQVCSFKCIQYIANIKKKLDRVGSGCRCG